MQVKGEKSQEEIIQALQHKVDELTAANRLLEDQLAAKEQFTAMIAHELRGPLTPIITYAQMLTRNVRSTKGDSRKTSQSEIIQRNACIIISQARRLNRLVSDLLDASRLTSDQFALRRGRCDLVELATETVEHIRPVAPYHKLIVEAPEASLVGNWDCCRLQQAIGNLLDNAIKYSDENTVITVRVWASGDTAHVSVHNQGVGIPSSDIGQLFRPYTRLQATSGQQGSGLGLYITKSIIEAHEGQLCLVPSSEEQRGTMFLITLPLHSLSEDL